MLVLALMSTLAGKVGAQSTPFTRCDQSGGCNTECANVITFAGMTFYKTTMTNNDCFCNGKAFPVYQEWVSATVFTNEFLYYRCSTGTWGTDIARTSFGNPDYSPDELGAHDKLVTGTFDTQCPITGMATCSATPSATPSASPPPTPSATPSSGPATTAGTNISVSNNANTPANAAEAATCSDDDAICAPMAGFLPGICSCSGTNGGTGSFTECKKSFPLIGDVGIRVELEPCDCGGAYAEVSYQAGGGWTTAGRLAAGETNSLPIPGYSCCGGAGLYADVTISGDKTKLVVDVHLSLCFGGGCNENIPCKLSQGCVANAYGNMAKSAGFPIALIEDFQGIDFTEQCKCAPDCSSDSSTGMIVGIVIAVVVVVLLVAGGVAAAVIYQKKKQAAAGAGGNAQQGGVALTTPSAVPVATPVETKI